MSDDTFDRIAACLIRFRTLNEADREAGLAALHLDDPGLHAEVISLLPHTGEEATPIDEPIVHRDSLAAFTDDLNGADHPDRIGPYRVLARIGSGGMGTVYRAQQAHPNREVAIKVLHRLAATARTRQRFTAEAEILGSLQHPCIAQVFDARTLDGEAGNWPYFVMEYIRGVPLSTHATEMNLGIEARLRLFLCICDAIEYAHRHGVVHRDLKPDNILVTPDGTPKILDFGIARVTNNDIQISTMHTSAGQVIGTVPYMSPEQLEGRSAEIDARSDVYSLGVVLFQLLTGRLPHDIARRSVPEAARIIRDEEPTRLHSIDTTYRGDIDTIVGKAIEKEAGRRYATAAELADDIRRHLDNIPISARPVSRAYQLQKFSKRNKGLVTGLAATMLAIVLGSIASLAFAFYGLDQQALAERVAEDAESASYRLSINLAAIQIQNDKQDRARETLLLAPADLREWEWHHLWNRLDPMYPVRREDVKNLAAIAGLTADGSWRIVAHDNGGYAVYDPENSQIVTVLEEAGRTGSLRLNPGATHIAGRVDGRVTMWETETGKRSWQSQSGSPLPDALSPDATTYSAFRYTPETEEWAWSLETTSGETLIHEGPGLAKRNFSTFSHDGAYLIVQTVLDDDTQLLLLINAKTGETVNRRELRGGRWSYSSPAWSPRNDRILIGYPDYDFTLIDAETLGTITRINRDEAPDYLKGGSYGCAFVDPQRVVITEHDSRITLIDLSTGIRRQLRGPDPIRPIVRFAGIGRGDTIVAGQQQWMTLIQTDHPAGITTLRDGTTSVYTVAWHPGSQTLATGSWDETLRLWDAETGEIIASVGVNAYQDKTDRPAAICFTDDGETIEALTNHDMWDKLGGTRHRWRPSEHTIESTPVPSWKRAIDTLPPGTAVDGQSPSNGSNFTGDYRTVGQVGTLIAEPSERGVLVSDRITGKPIREILCGRCVVAFSTDDRTLFTGNVAGTVIAWDIATGNKLASQQGYTSKVYGFAIHPNARRIAVVGEDGGVLLDAITLEIMMQIDGHDSFTRAAAFSPDGTFLATASGDGTVRLWNGTPHRGAVDLSISTDP